MSKSMKRGKKTATKSKVTPHARSKKAGQSATPSRSKRSGLITRSMKATAAGAKSLAGGNLIAKATRTLKGLLKPESPSPVTSVNLMKPEDPAHRPGHRHLNLKESKTPVPTQELRRTPKHLPLKIPQ